MSPSEATFTSGGWVSLNRWGCIGFTIRCAYASMQPRRPQGHLAPPSFTTTWPISPAPPPTDPRLAVEDDPPAHARAPEHAEDRLVRLAGAEPELRVRRDLHVVADGHLGSQ